jgi:hypothetical protein
MNLEVQSASGSSPLDKAEVRRGSDTVSNHPLPPSFIRKGNLLVNISCLCVLLLLLPGCSGKLKPEVARKVISTELSIPEKQIKIISTSSISNAVVADATIQLSFTMQLGSDGKWHILKISRTPGQWEDPKNFQLSPAMMKSLESALQVELQKH